MAVRSSAKVPSRHARLVECKSPGDYMLGEGCTRGRARGGCDLEQISLVPPAPAPWMLLGPQPRCTAVLHPFTLRLAAIRRVLSCANPANQFLSSSVDHLAHCRVTTSAPPRPLHCPDPQTPSAPALKPRRSLTLRVSNLPNLRSTRLSWSWETHR